LSGNESEIFHRESQNHRLEKTSKIIKSNELSHTTMPTKPYPEMPHPHVF